MKNLIVKSIAKAAEYSASKAVNSASIWGLYQPKEPKELKQLKRK